MFRKIKQGVTKNVYEECSFTETTFIILSRKGSNTRRHGGK